MEPSPSEVSSPDEVLSVDVGADHLHAAGVDQRLDAQLHTGPDHVLRAWEEKRWSERQRRRSPEQVHFLGHLLIGSLPPNNYKQSALNSNQQQQQRKPSASLDVTEEKHLTVHLLLLAGDQSCSWQGSDGLDTDREPSGLLLLLLLTEGDL